MVCVSEPRHISECINEWLDGYLDQIDRPTEDTPMRTNTAHRLAKAEQDATQATPTKEQA